MAYQEPADRGIPAGMLSLAPYLGDAVNFRGRVPAYDGRRTSLNLQNAGMDVACLNHCRVLWVFRCDRDTVEKQTGVVQWSGLGDALIGLGRWLGNMVVVYSRSKAASVIDASIDSVALAGSLTGSGNLIARIAANQVLDTQMIPVNLGQRTPFFLL